MEVSLSLKYSSVKDSRMRSGIGKYKAKPGTEKEILAFTSEDWLHEHESSQGEEVEQEDQQQKKRSTERTKGAAALDKPLTLYEISSGAR